MNWLKRFIARLFNIQLEDLPAAEDKARLTPEIKKEIGDEISRQTQAAADALLLSLEGSIKENIQEHLKQYAIPDQPVEMQPPSPEYEEQVDEEGLESDELSEFPLIEEHAAREVEPAPTPDKDRLEIPDLISTVSEPKAEEEIIRLGIDFGTTTTAVALKIGDELPEALPIGEDGVTRYIPSVVYFQPGSGDLDSRVVVGEEAERASDQDFVIRSVKRCLACVGNRCQEHGMECSPFPWCHGDGKIQISDKESLNPQDIAYFIMREALNRSSRLVEDKWAVDLTRDSVSIIPLNMGCSANFNLEQRTLIQKAAFDLGFTNVKIENVVEEPILAGFTFSRFADDPEGRALIYDYGGGTFDVAIIEVDSTQEGRRVTVLTTSGESWLGGDDIDALVYEYFLSRISQSLGIPASSVEAELGSIERSRLRTLARQAKEQLSSAENFADSLLSAKLGPVDIQISRDEFEHALAESGMVDTSLQATRRACQLAYVYQNSREGRLLDPQAVVQYDLSNAYNLIDRVVLVGGVTKTPYIRDRMEELFPRKIVSEAVIEPVSAVAIGGAYPREPQHYSLVVPPFGFILEASCVETGKLERWELFEPYEYYKFHTSWASSAKPKHVRVIDIPDDMRSSKLYCQKAGEDQPVLHDTLGAIPRGPWQFCITLEGEMFMKRVGGERRDIAPFPVIHPIQEAILKARSDQMRAERQTGEVDFDEWRKDLMSEN